jgi:hypothetical protein
LNEQKNYGFTPASMALMNGKPEAALLLNARGAEPRIKTKRG